MSKQAKQTFDHIFVANTVGALNGLRNRRVAWEKTDYKKANEGLYALLADCLAVFEDKFVNAAEADKKGLRNELAAKLKADGVKVQNNTTTLTMFVRFVFGSDRKRAHGYAYVLKAAISQSVAANELPDYINKQGGIEEIKRKMVVSEKTLQKREQIAVAKTEVQQAIEQAAIKPLAKIKLANITGDFAVLLAKPGADGEVAVVGALSDINEALVNALMLRMAKAKAEADAESAALHKETADLLAVPESSNDAQILNELAA